MLVSYYRDGYSYLQSYVGVRLDNQRGSQGVSTQVQAGPWIGVAPLSAEQCNIPQGFRRVDDVGDLRAPR